MIVPLFEVRVVAFSFCGKLEGLSMNAAKTSNNGSEF